MLNYKQLNLYSRKRFIESFINHKVQIINPRGFEDNDQDGGSASWFIVKGVTI